MARYSKEKYDDVIRCLRRGLTNKEIADELGIGIRTVKWWLRRLYVMFGLYGSSERQLIVRIMQRRAAKLSPAALIEIKKAYVHAKRDGSGRWGRNRIAAKYGVHPTTISHVIERMRTDARLAGMRFDPEQPGPCETVEP